MRTANLGATYLGGGRCRFLVWAPRAESVAVHLVSPSERVEPLQALAEGYYSATLEAVEPGARYLFRLGGGLERPDPASRFQPDGVHAPSEVVDPSRFVWGDEQWFGIPLEAMIIYELHVGTFSHKGTFDGVIPHLRRLRELGVTAIELMPVGQFPGSRNWGYDGAYPFAVQSSYGGPEALRRLIDASHREGLAVVLDVVYNHLGPEGNYLAEFGPYFTDRYRTPWGSAINFDGAESDEVRRFFIENALYWLTDFHVDALRLDAVHAIYDFSARTFLEELKLAAEQRAREVNRRFHLIAESDLNDPRLIRSRDLGGFGLDAQWSDDLHHALHSLLTGERGGYYQDFGSVARLAAVLRNGYAYTGQYSAYRRRRHGSAPATNAARQFVVCSQNHDQVGNRMLGERLTQLVSFEELKLAAVVVLLSPFVPLLFMGEEYGETAPFLYFTSHSDADLVEAVRRGRRLEFAAFEAQGEPPDPNAEDTFLRSRLSHEWEGRGRQSALFDFYRSLIRLRNQTPALAHLSKEDLDVHVVENEKLIVLRRWASPGVLMKSGEGDEALILINFGDEAAAVAPAVPPRSWRKIIESSDRRWLGPGVTMPDDVRSNGALVLTVPPRTAVVYLSEED